MKCPTSVVERGILVLGNFYEISEDKTLLLKNDVYKQAEIDEYFSHIEEPIFNTHNLMLSNNTISYLHNMTI